MHRISSTSSNDATPGLDSEDSFDNNHVSHVKREKKLLLMLMHAANYSLNHVVKAPRRIFVLTSHEWVQEIINGHDV